jgi:hypothetical protein
MNSITYDELLKTYNEVINKFPKQEFIKAVYLTNPGSWLIPSGSFLKVDYEGDKYWFIGYEDFQKIKKQIEDNTYRDDIPMIMRQGTFGELIGIPVFQDEEFIRKVLVEKFTPKENPFTSVFRLDNIS